MKKRANRLRLFSAMLAASFNVHAAIFSCVFTKEMKLNSFEFEELGTTIGDISERYIFYVDESGSGKSRYKSGITESEDALTALPFGAGWILLEGGWSIGVPNRGDNFFMVTVFTDEKDINGYRAIKTFQAMNHVDFYLPKQSFGYCK